MSDERHGRLRVLKELLGFRHHGVLLGELDALHGYLRSLRLDDVAVPRLDHEDAFDVPMVHQLSHDIGPIVWRDPERLGVPPIVGRLYALLHAVVEVRDDPIHDDEHIVCCHMSSHRLRRV